MRTSISSYRAMMAPTLIAFLLSLLPVCGAQAQEAGRVIVIEADEWCPINCSAGPQPGVGIELAKRIFEPMGYMVVYKVVPWITALSDARSGKADAVVGANRNDDRNLVFPDNALFDMTDDFYVRKGNPWRYQGVHTLKDKRIGIISGYGYGEVVTSFLSGGSGIQVTASSGAKALLENISKLQDGKIDVIIESKPVMEYTLSRMELREDIVWAGGVAQLPVYLAFAPGPKATELRVVFDSGMRRLKASGELNAIYAAYGLRR